VNARPLRVGLNLLFLGAHAGGAGRYAAELPGALLAAAPNTHIDVFLSSDAPQELRHQPWSQAVRFLALPAAAGGSSKRLLAEHAGLPLIARARRLDILHSPANTGPVLAPGAASVITLLDLIWLHRAAEWEADARAHAAMRRQVAYCLRHADRVFAISEDAAADFTRTLRVPRTRIDVTPLGIRLPQERAPDAAAARALRAQLQLGESRIVLCVAQQRPYKNLARLIAALPALPPDVTLVLAGAHTPHQAELRARAAELRVSARVRFTGWLPDTALDALYALSHVFVLPSLIEGFGIPILEAFARGVPVACSNVSALPEVAGDAALLFDPARQDDLTGAVRQLLEDRALAARLVARGRARAAELSWKRTGEASIAGYRRALAARAAPRRPGRASR
jgi:glycosyltransferase involved in cell wall biosynthesis